MPYKKSPLPNTIDKFYESYYFLHEMMHLYHEPLPFIFNLSAFVQALHNTRQMLFKELDKSSRFSTWKESKLQEMGENELLRKFYSTRRLVVHQSSLKTRSKAFIGLYRGMKVKQAIQIDRLLRDCRPAPVRRVAHPDGPGIYPPAEYV